MTNILKLQRIDAQISTMGTGDMNSATSTCCGSYSTASTGCGLDDEPPT